MQHQVKVGKYSFPVASVFLGMFVGTFMFLHQSPDKKEYPAERFFRPAFLGMTTTYLVLSVGVNLRLAKDRRARKGRGAEVTGSRGEQTFN